MSKIGDLFVRLGLKKDEFDKGIKDAGSKIGEFLSKMKSFGGAVTTVMAVAGAAVSKFAKDAVAMTQKWGDQWAVTVAGIQGAYQAFVRQLSSGDGWDNLFANMREAARVARETAAALDEIFERKMSLSYEEAATERQIAQLQLIMRDSSKTDAEREAAAKEIIRLEEQLGNVKRDIAQQEATAYRNSFKSQTQLNDEQIDFLLKEYNSNRDIINQGRAYLEERKKYESDIARMNGSVTGAGASAGVQARANLDALEANTSQAIKDVAELIKNYDKSSDELVANLVNAEVAVINVDTAVAKAQTRATTMLGSLNKGSASSAGSGTDKQAEQAAAILKRAQDSAKSEIQLLYEKYQTEKALLEQYGIDTYALTDEYFRNLRKIMEKGVDEAFEPLEKLEPIEVEPIEIDWSEIDAQAEEGMMEIRKLYEQTQELANAFGQAVATGFSSACEQLASQLMGLSDLNAGEVIKALLTPLADMAIKMGEIIMAEGVAMQAAKMALKNPITAIAAGAALIAIGAAAKAGLEAVAKGGTTTTSVGASGYSGDASTSRTQDLQTELVITVEGRLSGSDILLAGQKTLDSWGR